MLNSLFINFARKTNKTKEDMTNYEITIGYKAVITVDIKANSEQYAKELAMNEFIKSRNKMIGGKVTLQDDNFQVHGVLNMDETWGMLNE